MLRTSRPIATSYLNPIRSRGFGYLLVVVLTIFAGACTSEATETTTELTVSIITTETTVEAVEAPAPLILEHKASLSLSPGQCYAQLTIAPPRNFATPESPWVDVVDCNGTHDGAVYAVGCLGNSTEGTELVAVSCPGQIEDPWPGKVELQRSSVKACLSQFEAVYSESYAETELRAVELVPTEETWLVGERRVICAIRGS